MINKHKIRRTMTKAEAEARLVEIQNACDEIHDRLLIAPKGGDRFNLQDERFELLREKLDIQNALDGFTPSWTPITIKGVNG